MAGEEKLFAQLRRLVASAETASRSTDRRRLLALETDLKALRAALTKRYEELGRQMSAASSQINAVTAYARCASLGRKHGRDCAANKTTE